MRIALVGLLAMILSGCAMMPVNKIRVYPELKKYPVKQVLVLGPGFDKKHFKYNFPGDLKEIDPENQQETADLLKPMLEDALRGAGLEVVTPYVPNESVLAWAKKNAAAVAKDQLMLRIEPVDVPAESVLLLGIVEYGRIMTQFKWKVFFEKNYHVVGDKRWEHVCDAQAVLVNPRTGNVIMEVRHRVAVEVYKEDQELMKKIAKEVFEVIANAFPKGAE